MFKILNQKNPFISHPDRKMELRNCTEVVFPESFHVPGDLIIVGCHNIQLPHELAVDGVLLIKDSLNVTVPVSIAVKKNVYLLNMNWDELPLVSRISGSLCVKNTPLKRISPKLKLGRSLKLNKTKVDEILLEQIKGSLEVSDTPLRFFGRKLLVSRRLILKHTLIDEITQEIHVKGNMWVLGQKLMNIKGMMTVGGSLRSYWAQLTIPEHAMIGGGLSGPIKRCSNSLRFIMDD